jgi:hypothetical protein
MNDALPNVDTSQHSKDRQAIADYFSSETYARRRSRHKVARPAADVPIWPNPVLTPRTSFWMGLCGLSVMLLVFGNAAPILSGALRTVIDANDSYVIFVALDQTAILPALVCFAFAIVTPMFWYGSVLVRFALAIILIVPGCLGFAVSSAWLDPTELFLLSFTRVVLAMFVVIGVVAVLVQMWSHWTLSHSRPIVSRIERSKTRYIMELTGVAAMAFAAIVSIETDEDELTEALLFFATLCLLSTGAVLGMLIGFLRPQGRNFVAVAASAMFAFATSFIYAAMHAFEQFGWDKLPDMLPEVMLVSVYGTGVLLAAMWLCVAWLRGSGWACVHRREEKRLREADRKDLWRFWFR